MQFIDILDLDKRELPRTVAPMLLLHNGFLRFPMLGEVEMC